MIADAQSINHLPFFKELAQKERQALADFLTLKHLQPGEELYQPLEKSGRVYIVLKGSIRLYQLSFDGRKYIVDILGPGSIFGDICPNCDWSFSLGNYAEAVSTTTIGQFSKDHFIDFITQSPKVALNVISEMNHRLHHLDLKTKSLALNDAEKRVLAELMLFAKDFGRQTKRAYVISQRLTHEVMAAMTGLTRESVTYAINSLRRQKVIRMTPKHHIWIMNDKVISNF